LERAVKFGENTDSAGLLTPDEISAIFAYTQEDPERSLYRKMNEQLREKNTSGPYMSYVRLLWTALIKLKQTQMNKDTVVYRGMKGNFSFTVGETRIWRGFTSCSLKREVAEEIIKDASNNQYIILQITTSTGVCIKDFSAYTAEEELLFFPGTCLKVTSVDPNYVNLIETESTDFEVLSISHLNFTPYFNSFSEAKLEKIEKPISFDPAVQKSTEYPEKQYLEKSTQYPEKQYLEEKVISEKPKLVIPADQRLTRNELERKYLEEKEKREKLEIRYNEIEKKIC